MHKGTGMSVGWILLVDTLAGSLIFLSISGGDPLDAHPSAASPSVLRHSAGLLKIGECRRLSEQLAGLGDQ